MELPDPARRLVRPDTPSGVGVLLPGPHDVPLELFVDALDRLAPECDRLALAGTVDADRALGERA